MGRVKTWGVTFLPPLVMSLLFPFGFVVAIGYAGAAATVWTCIVPALLVKKCREAEACGVAVGEMPVTGVAVPSGFRAPGGQGMIALVMGFGIITALFHFLSMFGWLPAFRG